MEEDGMYRKGENNENRYEIASRKRNHKGTMV